MTQVTKDALLMTIRNIPEDLPGRPKSMCWVDFDTGRVKVALLEPESGRQFATWERVLPEGLGRLGEFLSALSVWCRECALAWCEFPERF